MTAVTGTNGKSTVTSMLWHILRRIHGNDSVCLIGGVSNIVRGIPERADQTTPDPRKLYRILSDAVKGGASYAVTEASSHALDYEKLSPCRIKLGVMTNLTEDHLDHHKTIQNYFESKGNSYRFAASSSQTATIRSRKRSTARISRYIQGSTRQKLRS